MKKILIVFGTRPEAIKMAPVVKEFEKHKNLLDVKVCVTGQHREMLDQVLEFFEIVPDFDLNIMKPKQNLYDVTSNILLNIKHVLAEFCPDIVFVHGDTSTTFTASLASFYQKIDIGHVEAGLRTDNIYSPWPEEANRQLIARLATYHFAPTEKSKANLIKENIQESNIIITGNTAIDALLLTLDKINEDIKFKIIERLSYLGYNLKANKKIILVTGHRRENHGEGFIRICTALKKIAIYNPSIDIVYPVHLNPNVQKPVNEILSGLRNIYLIEPLKYQEFVYIMDKSYFVITDSGGIQEEAPSLGKPVLVMRDTTERPEAVEAGTVKLVGTDVALIVSESQKLIDNQDYYNTMSRASNPFGKGNAASIIVKYFIDE